MLNEERSSFFQWGPREAAVLPLTLTLEGAMTMDRAVRVSWPTTWVLFQRETARRSRLNAIWLSQRAQLIETGRACFEYIDSGGVTEFFDVVQRASQTLHNAIESTMSLALRRLSDEDMCLAYGQLREAYVDWWRPNYVVEPLEFYAESRSAELFGEGGALALVANGPTNTMEGEVHEALGAILERCLQDKDVTSALLSRDTRRVCELMRGDAGLRASIESFLGLFFWLRNNYYRSGGITFDECCHMLVEHCDDVRTGSKVHQETDLEVRLRNGARQRMEDAAREHGDAAVLLNLWDTMAQFKDERKRMNLIANHAVDLILREACRRRQLPLSDARNLLPNEVEQCIRGEALPRLIERRNGLVVLWRAGEAAMQCLYEPDMAALAHAGIGDRIARARSRSETEWRITGTPNGYGQVEGVAYVCPTYEDALRIPSGSDAILITNMTSPEWNPIMARVKGVVTAEGGQASHAFLSCSQRRIPLIIDAQGAVDSRLDGAAVRLDAKAGVLEVLKTAD